MRQGKSALSHLQMLDEQSRLNESTISQTIPTGSVKEQLETLIAQIGFEAHKAEAVLADNNV